MYSVLYQTHGAALDTYVCSYVDSLCHCEFSSVCCTTFYQCLCVAHLFYQYLTLIIPRATCPSFIQTNLVQKFHSRNRKPIAFTLQVYC